MLTQKEKLSNALLAIKGDVTANDRAVVCRKLKITRMTVSTYINGQGADNDLAVKILNVLTQQIQKRDELIKATA